MTLGLLSLMLALATPAQAQFASDTFTEASVNTELSLHTPDSGGSWAEHGSYSSGELTILALGDSIAGNGASGLYYHSASPANANYEVEIVIFVDSNAVATYPVVAGRINTAADTMYRAFYDQPGGQWVLDLFDGGAYTSLGTASQSLTNSSTYTLTLVMNGNQISAKVGGATVIGPVTNAAITAAGKAGVGSGAANGQQPTSFTATDIGGGSTCRPGTRARMGFGC